MGAGLAALLLVTGAQAETARGVVFEDENRNGVRDAGEPGIAGVRVSNGRDVVLTDRQGRYRIEAFDESVLFITKPSGYATPVNAHNLPQFHYVHSPEGSPAGMRYRGIEPTGPLPDSIDFPLILRPEREDFEAILLSDTQPQTERELDYIRDDVVAELIGTDAAFGMTMGDILFDDLSMFPRYNALIGSIGIPWYNVPGNHELNYEAEDDAHALETFKRYFGPPYYAFEYGRALFVVLDNIYYNGNGRAGADDVRGDGGYVHRITEAQLDWLEAELSHVEDERLVFVAMHAPLGSETRPESITENRERLFDLLEGRPNLYSVAGHTHTTSHQYYGPEDGFDGPGTFHHHVLAVVSGAWWSGPFDADGVPIADQSDGTPNGYHVLEVSGTDLAVRYKGAGLPVDEQMRIVFDVAHHGLSAGGQRDFSMGELLDGRMRADEVPAASIVVNLFDGGPRSVVEYSVAGGPWMPLERVLRADPYMVEVYNRNAASKKAWVDAGPSTHVFEADLQDDLPPGTHVVSVRATDEFGRSHHGHTILEITAGWEGSSAGLRYPD
jgi:hypothetical protein